MKVLKAALIGVGVMLACFVPPIVHFVTGPLSPVIGGFVAGLRLRCRLNQAAVVGAIMAGVLLLVTGAVVAIATAFIPGLLPSVHWTILVLAVAGTYLYVFWLAMLGAWAGGAFARRSEPASTSAGQSSGSVRAGATGTSRPEDR